MEVLLVGGAVRDQLLGLPVKERDYVVLGATPEQMIAAGFYTVGKYFPVFLHPLTHEEYALARTERKTGPGYKGFTCYAEPDVSLTDDLRRRDLTINAMAQTAQGEIIDPYNGQADLTNRYLRHVSPAFTEDPVRVLRLARFMARFAHLDFRIAEETLELTKRMVDAGELSALAPERIWREFSLALTEPTPQAFIKVLLQCGALAAMCATPRVNNDLSSKQRITLRYAISSLKKAAQLTEDPQIRFAALYGALSTHCSCVDKPSNSTTDAIQGLSQRYGIPARYTTLARMTAHYQSLSHQALQLPAPRLLELLAKTDAFRKTERFKQFLLACEIIFNATIARPSNSVPPYPQKAHLLSALTVAQAVSVKALLAQGLTGIALAKQLQLQRINAIETSLYP